MDVRGDHNSRKYLHAWSRLWVQFASITIAYLVTLFGDGSFNPVTKHCITSKPSVLLSLWSKVKGKVKAVRRNSHMISCAWSNHIHIGVLKKTGTHNHACCSPGSWGKLPISAWVLSTGLGGGSLHGISETESLFFPILQTGILLQLISSSKGNGSSQFSFAPEIRNIPTPLPSFIAHPWDLQPWFPERSLFFALLHFHIYILIQSLHKCCFWLS